MCWDRRRRDCEARWSCFLPAEQPRSAVAAQLLDDGWILQSGNVLRDLVTASDAAQQPPHDLAGAGLGQVVSEANVVRLGDGAELFGDPATQFLDECSGVTRRSVTLADHEREH